MKRLVLAFVAACATVPTGPSPQTPAPSRALAPKSCPAPTTAREPQVLTLDWSEGSKIELSDAMARHVAVVRYDCEGLEVLRDCRAAGKYSYVSVSPARSALRFETRDELKTNLLYPGAMLERAVDHGETVDLAWIIVGEHFTTTREIPRGRLEGACSGATHTVRAASVGAYALATGARDKPNAGAELLGRGPMAVSVAPVERTGGELQACYLADFGAATPIAKCKALVHVVLSPITEDPGAEPLVAVEDGPDPDADARVAPRERFVAVPVRDPSTCDFTNQADCEARCAKGDAKSCWNAAANRLDTHLNPTHGVDPRPEAFPLLEKSCALGFPRACGVVGEATRHGTATTKDVARGDALLEKACQMGDALSCIVIANGDDSPAMDPKVARTHYDRACALGNTRGCAESGLMQERGMGGPRDVAAAIQSLERACAASDQKSCDEAKKIKDAQAALAGAGAAVAIAERRVEVGVAAWPSPCKAELRADEKARTCVKPDPARTFLCDAAFYDECRAQCQKGSVRSCWNAAANRRGSWSRGQKNRDEDATAFLERACKAGFAPACAEMGYIYGRPGSKQDRDRARALLEKACDAKDPPACMYLASFLKGASGGWSYDPRAAGVFYERACDMGAFSACYSGAAALATDVDGVYQDPARAQHLLEVACKHNDRRACRILPTLPAK